MNAWFGKRRFAFQVGNWSVDPEARELVSGERRVRLEPLTMKLLLLLIGNRDRITPRAEILDSLWGGRIATDDAVDRQLAKLRAALGRGQGAAGAIETLPKTGVRLTLAVVPLLEQASKPSNRRPLFISALALATVAALLIFAAQLPRSRADQVDIRPLTFDRGEEIEPAVSPDGQWVVYAARSELEGRFGLYLRRLTEDFGRRISPSGIGARMPAWSPTGRQLAFFARSAENCSIMVGSVARARFNSIAACNYVAGGLAWVGEDRLVVADRARDIGPMALSLIDVRTGGITPLSRPDSHLVGDSLPLVSGDGATIYFVRMRTPYIGGLCSLDLATGAIRQISREAALILGVAHGRDGKLLVAAIRGGGASALWEIDPRRGEWSEILPVEAGLLSSTSDGAVTVFQQYRMRSAIWRVAGVSSIPQQVTNTTRFDRQPAVSPDGRWLAFISNRGGSSTVWLKDLRTGSEQHLRAAHLILPQSVSWSPDSKTVVVPARDGDKWGLFFFHLDTQRLDRLGLPGSIFDASYSADGSRLYLSRWNGVGFSIVELSLGARQQRTVVENALRPAIAPDGTTLLFTRPFERGLWRLDLSSGSVGRLSDKLQPGDRLNWAVSNDGAWLPDRQSQRLILVDVHNGQLRASRPLPDLSGTSGLSAANGNLYFALAGEADSDLYLVTR